MKPAYIKCCAPKTTIEMAKRERPRSSGQFVAMPDAEESRPFGRIPAKLKPMADKVRHSKARVRSVPLCTTDERGRQCKKKKSRGKKVPREIADWRPFHSEAMLKAARVSATPSM